MNHPKISLNVIKGVALLMAIAAILLVVTISTAAGRGGDDPAAAVILDNEVNRGHLEPLEQHWFKFTPDKDRRDINVEKSLTLIFTPKETYTADFVHFTVFEEEQIAFFSEGETSNMAIFGGGSLVERDGNPVTGELVWTGWTLGSKTYYIQVINVSDFPIDYHLFNADVKSAPLGEPEPPPEAGQPSQEAEAAVTIDEVGIDPVSPAQLNASGVTHSKLEAGEIGWYEFSIPDPGNENQIVGAVFTVKFTPDDGNRKHDVKFELFAAHEIDMWLRGEGKEGMTNFGAGQIVDRDRDYNTGEYVWRGSVNSGDKYLLSIQNGTDVEIDFWVFDGDIYDAELGPKTISPSRVFGAGEAPPSAVPLKIGENVGRLDPGQQAWYRFVIADFDDEPFEEMALTMIFTPNDGGNRVHYVTFEVFEASGVKYWSPTDVDNSQITNMGAGSIIVRDDNYWTGERSWKGWVVDNNTYWVQVNNGSDVPVDYHLFTGDVYRPPLGGETQPAVEIAAAEGTSPNAALDLGLGANKGSLAVGEELWYRFSRSDVPAGGGETVFTLVFTPNDGQRVNQVSVELFDTNQVANWTPNLVINGFGETTTLDRDKKVETGEIHWRGIIQPNAAYYVRLTNNSDVPVGYWLFPEDVVDANLE